MIDTIICHGRLEKPDCRDLNTDIFMDFFIVDILRISSTGNIQIYDIYRKTSKIRHSKSQNDSHLILQLFLSNPLKPSVQSRMKMYLEQRRQAMLYYIWVINKFIAY